MNETTFENAKVGDRVWSSCRGWGLVVSINDTPEYPLSVKFKDCHCTYLFNGCLDEWSFQTLFWSEIKFEAPPRPKRKVKKVIEGWVNICTDGICACIYATKEAADKGSSGGRRLGEPLFIHHEYEVEE